MAPGNNFCPNLQAPFVNHDLMLQTRFADRLVRVPCVLQAVRDVTTAIVVTADGGELNVNLTTAFKRRVDGTFSPAIFPPGKKYYVLEGIVKNDGWWLILMKQPEVIGECDMRFINQIIEFACDEDWLYTLGRVPPDPRLELGYTGGQKPDILKLVTYDNPLTDKDRVATKSPAADERESDGNDSIEDSDFDSFDPGSVTENEYYYDGNITADGIAYKPSPLLLDPDF